MSLFESSITGNILNDGSTTETTGVTAGQLATVLTAYTPLTDTAANTTSISTNATGVANNAAAIAALQSQVDGLPPYALASDLAAAEGLIAANSSSITALNTSLTTGLANKANQSALDALQLEVSGKSTPASVDTKLQAYSTTASMNSAIASASNTTLASVAANYALRTVTDQLALDLAGKQSGPDVDQKIATALLDRPSTTNLAAAVGLKTTPADVDQRVATALLTYVTQVALDAALALRDGRLDSAEASIASLQAAGFQTAAQVAAALLPYAQQTALDAALALRDARLDGHDADILALQAAGPFATSSDLTSAETSLQSAIDAILAQLAVLATGGASTLINAQAWPGEITWDLLLGTNTLRNLHFNAPLSVSLQNDNFTLSLSCDSYSVAETDALLAPKASESWVLATLGGYYTEQETDDAIAGALSNYFTQAEDTASIAAAVGSANGYTDTQLTAYSTTVQMNAAIAAALVPYSTTSQMNAAIAAALATVDLTDYWTIAQAQAAITAALVPVTLSNGQSWNGGPTFNLLRGTNVLRNLSVAGALTATFQNLDDTILIESDSYARSETYTQLETGAAITTAIDALNLSQYRTEAQVLALIAGELVPYWDQTEVSSFVAGELSNYQTDGQVSSAISSALTSYDNSNQVDSKITTALLDYYTRAETDQAITNAVSGSVDLSAYYTSAETQSYVADELLAYYPRTELDSQLTATFTQYWTSGRTQTEIDDALAGSGFLDQTAGDARYFVRAPGAESGQIFNLVQEQFTPRIVRNLLLEAPLVSDAILGNQSTLRIRSDSSSKAEADGRFLRTNDLGPLDARYFVATPGTEGGGIFNLAQTQFTPNIIRNLLCQTPLSAQPILGNGSTLQISCDCWSKGQSDARYPLIANFNSLGSQVTSIDNRVTTLENSGGVTPTADLTVNSLTATTFVDTPQLQSAAGDLQIQNALVTIRKEDGVLLASFADGGISLDRDVTVAAASTLNATTADFAQLLVGSTAATGTFNSSSSVTANLEVVSNLRVEAPLVRCDPAAPWLSIEGGVQGVLVNDTLLVNGAIAPEASLPYLYLSGGTAGLEMNTKFAVVTGLGDPGGFCELAVINQAPTGVARLFLSTQDNTPAGGKGELVALADGGLQLNASNQFISLNTTSGLANLAIEPNTGGSNNGEVIVNYGFVNLSDRSLKTNLRPIPQDQAQETFDKLEPQYYDRVDGPADQIGFVAQDVEAAGPLGKALTKTLEDRELMTLDYQKMFVVLWGVCKRLQSRIETLEKGKRIKRAAG